MAANRLLDKEKNKKRNPIATAGITEQETAIEEVETKSDIEIEEIKKESLEEHVEAKSEPVKQVKEEKTVDHDDLFTLKKKVKIKKGQKNLHLKEDNIEALVNFANKYRFGEGEVVDYLIENYLKLIKIK